MIAPSGAETYFGARSTLYDDHYDARTGDGHALRARMAVVIRLAGDGPGAVLDAGMGPGRLCGELARRRWEVSGVDASSEMVEMARRRLRDDSQRLRQARIEALPFERGSFDLAVATGVLEYVEVETALRELVRVLRPGGRLVVSYPNPLALYAVWKTHVFYRGVRGWKRLRRRGDATMPRGGKPIAPARFSALLRQYGLKVEGVEYSSYLVVPTPLDQVLPHITARLGEWLEGSPAERAARSLATQVVYLASKTG
jgi:SAM-dependent methyltransferase